MKRISFFLVLALLLSFGLANAEQSVSVSSVDGYFNDPVLGAATGGDCLKLGSPAVFHINTTNTDFPDCWWLPGYGFDIHDNGGSGATWTWPTSLTVSADAAAECIVFDEWIWVDSIIPGIYHDTIYMDGLFGDIFREFQDDGFVIQVPDGVGHDYIGIAGVSTSPNGLFGPGQVPIAPAGADHDFFKILLTPVTAGVLCLDIDLNMPSYEWGWSPLAFDPATPCTASDTQADWGGPYCYTVAVPPDQPPEFGLQPCTDAGPTTIELNPHCVAAAAVFCATDPDPGQGGGPDDVSYSTDLGSIDDDGNWALDAGTFGCADVGSSISMIVVAHEADNPLTDTLLVNINLVNDVPAFTAGCDVTTIIGAGELGVFAFDADDVCHDALTYSVTDVAPSGTVSLATFIGTAVIVGSTLEVTPDVACIADDYVFEVCVADCMDEVCCNVTAKVIQGDPYEVVIEKTEFTPQGQFETVSVSMKNQANPIGGFNFLIAYDASALTFQGADVDGSPLYEQCGWEYFTYRFGPDGNCGNACPSGLLRVVGIAETNNGPFHPTCFGSTPPAYVMFNLNFLVSNNRNLECMYVPIRFFWIECGDNTISSQDGTQLFINNKVWANTFDPDDTYWSEIQDFYADLPAYTGAPEECETSDKAIVERAIGFFNGGIDIVCSNDIDDRGDINQNGLAYEIADAVMFSNYFINGLGAFVAGAVDGSIAATDVNADGLTLSVADLVYLIRVIVGDALPYDNPFLKPSTATYTYHNGTVSVNSEMGAAAFTFNGEVDLELLAPNMDLKFAYDGEVTRALVYSLDGNTFNGDVLRGDNMISLELGSANGGTVITNLIPSEFALNQNYPNPFNPVTAVPFSLPTASDVTLKVYNIAGQLVTEMSGNFNAGNHSFEIDGNNFSSGVYFYRLDAGSFTDTKKMVLLK